VVEALLENVFAAAPRKVVVAKMFAVPVTPEVVVPVSVPDRVWVPEVPEKYKTPVLLPEVLKTELLVKLPAIDKRVGKVVVPEPELMVRLVVEAFDEKVL